MQPTRKICRRSPGLPLLLLVRIFLQAGTPLLATLVVEIAAEAGRLRGLPLTV
jgi:hypothetical protein